MKFVIFKREAIAPAASEPYVPTPEEQLAELDTEEQRWESLFEGTTIPTDRIMAGIKDVRARREAMLEAQAPEEPRP